MTRQLPGLITEMLRPRNFRFSDTFPDSVPLGQRSQVRVTQLGKFASQFVKMGYFSALSQEEQGQFTKPPKHESHRYFGLFPFFSWGSECRKVTHFHIAAREQVTFWLGLSGRDPSLLSMRLGPFSQLEGSTEEHASWQKQKHAVSEPPRKEQRESCRTLKDCVWPFFGLVGLGIYHPAAKKESGKRSLAKGIWQKGDRKVTKASEKVTER